MVGSKRYFKRLAYSCRQFKARKNRHLRKDQRRMGSACLSRKLAMLLVHKLLLCFLQGPQSGPMRQRFLFLASSISFINALASAAR